MWTYWSPTVCTNILQLIYVRFVPKFLIMEAENNWLFVHKNFWLKRKIPSLRKSSESSVSFDNAWKRFLIFVWMVSNLQILQLIWYFSSMSLLRLFHEISGLKFLTTTTASATTTPHNMQYVYFMLTQLLRLLMFFYERRVMLSNITMFSKLLGCGVFCGGVLRINVFK